MWASVNFRARNIDNADAWWMQQSVPGISKSLLWKPY